MQINTQGYAYNEVDHYNFHKNQNKSDNARYDEDVFRAIYVPSWLLDKNKL